MTGHVKNHGTPAGHDAPTARTYGGATQAERQARRRAALIDATLELLAEGGIASVTAVGVCRRSNLNQRYFAESFEDCEALLEAVFEHVAVQAVEFGTSISANMSAAAPGLTAEIMAGLVKFVADDPGRRAVLLESQATPALRMGRGKFVRLVAQIVETKAREPFGSNPPNLDMRIPSLVIANGALDTVAMWIEGTIDITFDELIASLTDMSTTVMSGLAALSDQQESSTAGPGQ